MEFNRSKVYTALNADELKIGSKVIFAPTIGDLKQYVKSYCDALSNTVDGIMPEYSPDRFLSNDKCYNLAYLVSEPKEKDWTVYICRMNPDNYYLTACRSDAWEKVQKDYGAKTKLFEGTEDEVDKWYVPRRHFADVIAAWEDGKIIQFRENDTDNWISVKEPKWSTDTQYRIEPKSLKWSDLKIGDVIRSGNMSYMITGIDTKNVTESHVHFAGKWRGDFELEGWEKVE